MFDLGFPPPLQQSIAKKFNQSVHPTCLVSYRPPKRVIHEYGYEVEFVDQVLSSMHGKYIYFNYFLMRDFLISYVMCLGSGEGHTAYIYKRVNTAPTKPLLPKQKVLNIPGRISLNEKDIQVFCDEAFYDASKLAVEDTKTLNESVKDIVNKHMDSTRPKRERKTRVITDASEL